MDATADKMTTQTLFDQAIRCFRVNNLTEAQHLCQQVLAETPRHADALNMLGGIAHRTGQNELALDLIGMAIDIDAGVASYHANLAFVLKDAEKFEDAVSAYQVAIRLKPEFANAHFHMGIALFNLKRVNDAISAYRTVIRLNPNFVEAHSNLGVALFELAQYAEAIDAYRAAIRVQPDFMDAHYNLGNALKELRRFDEAIASYQTAIRIKPDFAQAHSNLGNTYKEQGRFEEAANAYREAIRVQPDYAQAYSNLGNALRELERFDDAIAACNEAIRIEPDYAEAYYNQSLVHLLLGDLSTGLQRYEWRWRRGAEEIKIINFAQPQWHGTNIDGCTILLFAEQGMGDAIQFCRYTSLINSAGGRVVLAVPRRLLRLLSTLKGVDRLIASNDALPKVDFYCPLMSLPVAFDTTVDTIPASVPYLSAEEEVVACWKQRLGTNGFKIGIAWQGNPEASIERGRSAPLACFAGLAKIPGVRLISLQKNHGLEQLEHLPAGMKVESLGADFDAGQDAFIDTAAVMMNLDLVITVDTAIGHLAGALGRPVWIALQAVPHWVWMLGRKDSPWYPSVRLFRQTVRDDWDTVFDDMVATLKTEYAVGQHASPLMVEIAPGELIDKITILQIKRTRIRDVEKLRHVEHEYRLCVDLQASSLPASPVLSALQASLQEVNETVWDIENDIREHETRGDFGDSFVALARNVYINNDRRAALKREINVLLNSALVEEKEHISTGAVKLAKAAKTTKAAKTPKSSAPKASTPKATATKTTRKKTA